MIDEFKGSLRGAKDFIIKNKIRNINGEPQHRSEFRLNDKASLLKYLSILKDKFGVDVFEIKGRYKKKAMNQQQQEIDDEIKHLNENIIKKDNTWREKTRGLRETDQEFIKKAKKIL